MHKVIAYSIALSLVAMCLFGFLAVMHIDGDKIGSMSRRSAMMFGPMVPEEILTATGKKWASLRNICAAVGLGGATLYGIAMKLLGYWQ
jgi:hypothetical protein